MYFIYLYLVDNLFICIFTYTQYSLPSQTGRGKTHENQAVKPKN